MNYVISKFSFIIPILLLTLCPVRAQNNDSIFVSTLVPKIIASGGLSVDNEGNIYASDFGEGTNNPEGKKIYKITLDGKVRAFTNEVFGPTGSAIGSDGKLYVSNSKTNSISLVTRDGKASIFAKNIPWPGGIVFDKKGNLFTPSYNDGIVRSSIGRSISKVTPNGDAILYVTSNLLNGPVGLTIDSQENLYVVNWHDRKIIKITPEKDLSVLATLPGNENQKTAHIVFWNENLYVAGANSFKIYKVTLEGKVSVLAGKEQPGSQDGDAKFATFGFVNGIAVSIGQNALIILDILPDHGRIRAIHFVK